MEDTNFITGTINWFSLNWSYLVELLVKIIGIASIVVKLTPTLKDDDVLKPILRFLGKYIALNRSSQG